MSKREVRFVALDDSEVRAEGEGSATKIKGFGVVYNKRSQDLGGFTEIIRPGAFRAALDNGVEMKSFFNHDPNYVLATTKSDPALIIRDRPGGIEYEFDVPDTSYGQDLAKNIRSRRVTGSSFSFRTIKDNWYMDGKTQMREILEAEIFEMGPVTNPAYLPSTADVRSTKDVYDSYTTELRAQQQAVEIDENRQASEKRRKELDLL